MGTGILGLLDAFEVLPRNKREAAARFLAELSTNEDLRSAVLSGGDPYMERYRDAYQRMFDVSPPRETYQPDRETRKDLFGSDLAVNMQRTSLPPTPEELAERKSLLEAMGLIKGLEAKRGRVAGTETPQEKGWWSKAMGVPTPYPAEKEMADIEAGDVTDRKLTQARTVKDALLPTDTGITIGDIMGITSPRLKTTRKIEAGKRISEETGVGLLEAMGLWSKLFKDPATGHTVQRGPKGQIKVLDRAEEKPSRFKVLKRISDLRKAKTSLGQSNLVTQILIAANSDLASQFGQKLDERAKKEFLEQVDREIKYLSSLYPDLEAFVGGDTARDTAAARPSGYEHGQEAEGPNGEVLKYHKEKGWIPREQWTE